MLLMFVLCIMQTVTQILISPEELQQMLNAASDAAVKKYIDQSKPEQEFTKDGLITQKEAWNYLRCSKSTLYKWKREGKIPFHKLVVKYILEERIRSNNRFITLAARLLVFNKLNIYILDYSKNNPF